MTKKGYKSKFIKTFLVLSFGLYFAFLYTSQNFEGGAIIGQYILSAMYAFIPSAVIALIWEFFSEE